MGTANDDSFLCPVIANRCECAFDGRSRPLSSPIARRESPEKHRPGVTHCLGVLILPVKV